MSDILCGSKGASIKANFRDIPDGMGSENTGLRFI